MIMTMGMLCWDCHKIVGHIYRDHELIPGSGPAQFEVAIDVLIWLGLVFGAVAMNVQLERYENHEISGGKAKKHWQDYWMAVLAYIPVSLSCPVRKLHHCLLYVDRKLRYF